MTNEQMNVLNQQLRFTGFNEQTDTELFRFTGLDFFELEQTTRYGDLKLEAILTVRKSRHYDVYFLSKHTLTLADKTHTFYLYRGKGITRIAFASNVSSF